MLRRILRALLAGGDGDSLGLTPGASGNVDEIRPLCKHEIGPRGPGTRATSLTF